MKKLIVILLVAAFILARMGTVGSVLAIILLAASAVIFVVQLIRNFDDIVLTLIGLLPIAGIIGLFALVLFVLIKVSY